MIQTTRFHFWHHLVEKEDSNLPPIAHHPDDHPAGSRALQGPLALSPVIDGRAIDCPLFPWFLYQFALSLRQAILGAAQVVEFIVLLKLGQNITLGH
jgi:hypothetical protein